MVLLALPLRQPTTMTHVEYQRVQHALPDGTPDPDAPDNFYIRATGTWYLRLDTDALAVDADGTKHVHLPGFEFPILTKFQERGRLRGRLRDRFKEVYPDQRPSIRTGQVTLGGVDETLPKEGGRQVYALVRTVVERVETHAEGKNRATCTTREVYWCTTGAGLNDHQPYVPTPISGVTTESKPPVRPTPPAYGYGPVALPRADDF